MWSKSELAYPLLFSVCPLLKSQISRWLLFFMWWVVYWQCPATNGQEVVLLCWFHMVIHNSAGQLLNLPCCRLTSLKLLHHVVSESGDHYHFTTDDSCACFFDSHFLYLIACCFCTIQKRFTERIERTYREVYREDSTPLCLLICLLAQSLPLVPLITQLLPPIPPFPLTCPLLITPPYLLTLPPTSPHPCTTSTYPFAWLSASAHTSAHLSDPAHTPLSVFSCCTSTLPF